MLKTFYQLGKIYYDDPEKVEFFKPWQNPYKSAGDKNVLVVDIRDKQLVTPIHGVEGFKSGKLELYLFREPAGPRGAHLTPTSFVFLSKKKDDLSDSLAKFYDRLRRTFEQRKDLYAQYLDLTSFWEKFKPAFEVAVSDLTNEGNFLITFRFDGKYPGEIPEMRALLIDEAYNKYKQTNKAKYVAENQVCAITGKPSKEVWGKIGLLGFTVDDEAFLRGSFEYEDAWKMFPVSSEVVPVLEGARAMIFDRLRFNLLSLRYLIVPKFIGWSDEDVKLATDELLKRAKNEQTHDAQGEAIIGAERIIFHIINSENYHRAGVAFDVFFYEENQAQLLLKLHLTDVMPSRMRAIKETKENVEKTYRMLLEKHIPGKGKKEDIVIKYWLNLANLKDYFSKIINKKTVFQPGFFKMLEAVLYGQRISEEFVLNAFQDKMIDLFKNYNEKEAWRFLDEGYRTFAFYQYLSQLGIFKSNPVQIMENQPVALTLEGFMAQPQHQDFFSNGTKKAAFICGCLVEKLLSVQRKQYSGNEPFRKNLNNLMLDPMRLRKIMQLFETKLQEYIQADYIPRGVAESWIINKAEAMAELVTNTEIKKVELSYAFTLGMVMEQAFKMEAKRLKKEQEEAEKLLATAPK